VLNLLNNLAAYADPLSKIGAGLAAIYGAWLWLSRLCAKQARAMTGDWTNEGDLTDPLCTHSVKLTTEVIGRHFRGTVQAWEATEHSPLASIQGWRCGPFMRGKVIYLRQGDLLTLGTITLRYRKRATTCFVSFKYTAPNTLYPGRAKLWQIAPRSRGL
jgi:hypothetical protein